MNKIAKQTTTLTNSNEKHRTKLNFSAKNPIRNNSMTRRRQNRLLAVVLPFELRRIPRKRRQSSPRAVLLCCCNSYSTTTSARSDFAAQSHKDSSPRSLTPAPLRSARSKLDVSSCAHGAGFKAVERQSGAATLMAAGLALSKASEQVLCHSPAPEHRNNSHLSRAAAIFWLQLLEQNSNYCGEQRQQRWRWRVVG